MSLSQAMCYCMTRHNPIITSLYFVCCTFACSAETANHVTPLCPTLHALSCTYLAHHELESVRVIIVIIIILHASLLYLITFCLLFVPQMLLMLLLLPSFRIPAWPGLWLDIVCHAGGSYLW